MNNPITTIDHAEVLAQATKLYREIKEAKYPHVAPGLLPDAIPSDQVKCVARVLTDQMNLRLDLIAERLRRIEQFLVLVD